MPQIITEDMIEQAAMKALQGRHDYTVLNCMTEDPDYSLQRQIGRALQ